MVLIRPCFAKIMRSGGPYEVSNNLFFLLFPIVFLDHGIPTLLLSTPHISGFSLKVPLSERRGQGPEPVSCTVLPRAVYPQRGLQRLLSRIYGKGWSMLGNGGAQTRGIQL